MVGDHAEPQFRVRRNLAQMTDGRSLVPVRATPGKFSFDQIDTVVRFRGRTVLVMETRRWLVALDDGIDHYTAAAAYHSDRRRNVVRIDPLANCAAGESAWAPDGSQRTKLIFPTRLECGHRHFFAYQVTVATDQEMTPLWNYRPTSLHDEKYIIRLQFDPAAAPKQVWWFADRPSLPRVDRPPAGEYFAVSPNRLGYVQRRFTALSGGLHYGLAWRWD
jgi:hypothetical protein